MKIRNLARLCMLLAICSWGGWYFYTNPKGLKKQQFLEKTNLNEKARLVTLQTEISKLKEKLIGLQSDPLEQEKIMREDLQMSCTNEFVYLLPS